jgi:asparagine synthase (glutamine-hydrolysing)
MVSAGIRPMLDSMRHYDWYREERFAAPEVELGSLALGWSSHKLYIGSRNEGSDVAALAGEIYDADDHRQRLEAEGIRFEGNSQSELCLRAFKLHGRRFFAAVNGKFIVAIWEPAGHRLTIIGDRFAMLPLYYATTGNGLIFATEIRALLAGGVERRVDEIAIARFFAFRQFMGDEAFIDGVRRLPPAGWLTFEPDKEHLCLERYWDARSLAGRPLMDSGEALNQIDHAFTKAVRRCTLGTPGLGVALSGGLDSRTILAAVPSSEPLSCVSLGVPGAMDLRLAQRLAHLTHRSFYPSVLDGEFLRDFEQYLRRMISLTEGQIVASGITVPVIDLCRSVGIKVLLRGHGGELMHMNKAYNYSLDSAAIALGNASALESWAFRHLAAPLFGAPALTFLTPHYRALVEPAARAALHAVLRESDGVEPLIHRLWLLFVTQYISHGVAASIVKFQTVAETRAPYIDADFIAALLSAPPSLKMGESIAVHLLRSHAPDFLEVPNTNTGAPVGAGRRRLALSHFAKRVLAKSGARGFQPYERLGPWLQFELRPFVERVVLSDRCLDRGIFERDVVRSVIDAHATKRQNHTWLILALLTFEIAQREFIDGEASS